MCGLEQAILSIDWLSKVGFLLTESGDQVLRSDQATLGGGASDWTATCPSCGHGLLHLLSTPEVWPAELGMLPSRRLPIFFCWRCGLSQAEFCYRLDFESQVVVPLRFGTGPVEVDFPYADYPNQFPPLFMDLSPMPALLAEDRRQWWELEFRGEDARDHFCGERYWDLIECRHQLGGLPFLHYPVTQTCPICDQRMKFLATVADGNGGEGFTGNPGVQHRCFLCVDCLTVSVSQECD